ncbi:hypothetical protein N9O21_01865 [Rhodobacteraceae bacterium]|nr:hypothetical protein [Paracoccaceae bacterium]
MFKVTIWQRGWAEPSGDNFLDKELVKKLAGRKRCYADVFYDMSVQVIPQVGTYFQCTARGKYNNVLMGNVQQIFHKVDRLYDDLFHHTYKIQLENEKKGLTKHWEKYAYEDEHFHLVWLPWHADED